jgi:von Willebrand factor type A domain
VPPPGTGANRGTKMAMLVNPGAARRSVWLPIALSGGLHALAFLGFSVAASWNTPQQAGGPALIDTVVIEDDVKLSLALPAAASPAAASAAQEQEAPPPVRIVGIAPSLAPVSPAATGAQPETSSHPANETVSTAGQPPAGRAGVGFLNASAQAHSVVYVIDRSVSMGLSGALDAAKRELVVSLNHLPATTRFQVILYNRHAEPLVLNGCHGLMMATDEIKQRVAHFVTDLHAEGGTAHLAALQQALALEPDVIFFVTDADDLGPELVRTVTHLNHGRAVIHAVELGPGRRPRDGALATLARANGGTYRAVDVAAR